jgi:hypothetical protein
LTFAENPVILPELHLGDVLTNLLDGVVAGAFLVRFLLGVIPTIVGHNTEFNGRGTTIGNVAILRVLYDSSSDLMSVKLHYFISL